MAAPVQPQGEPLAHRPGYPSLPNWGEGRLVSVQESSNFTVEDAAESARSRFKCGVDEQWGDDDLVSYYYTVMHHRSAEGRTRKPRSQKVSLSHSLRRCLNRPHDTCARAGACGVEGVRREAPGEVREHQDQVD